MDNLKPGTSIIAQEPDGTFKCFIIEEEGLTEIHPVLYPQAEETAKFITDYNCLYDEKDKRYHYLKLKGVPELSYEKTEDGTEEQELCKLLIESPHNLGCTKLQKAETEREMIKSIKARNRTPDQQKRFTQLKNYIANTLKPKIKSMRLENFSFEHQRAAQGENHVIPDYLYFPGVELYRKLEHKQNQLLLASDIKLYDSIVEQSKSSNKYTSRDYELFDHLNQFANKFEESRRPAPVISIPGM